jgi:hypothetical protein
LKCKLPVKATALKWLYMEQKWEHDCAFVAPTTVKEEMSMRVGDLDFEAMGRFWKDRARCSGGENCGS